MATPYLSEIRIFSFNFPPKGWVLCNGQTLPINQNQALFSLLGTTYGGNGTSTFNLPNLQGRIAMSQGNGFVLGESAGEVNHTLTVSEIPNHTHPVNASSGAGNLSSPQGAVWAKDPNGSLVYGSGANTALSAGAVVNAGSSQPHNNLMPYLVVSFCIAIQGIFPSRS
jgi:microcystin-dependent protein